MDWQLGGIGLYSPEAMAERHQLGAMMPGMMPGGMMPGMNTSSLLSFGGGIQGLGMMPGMYGLQDPDRAFEYYQKQNDFGYKMQDANLQNQERLYYNQSSAQNRMRSSEGVVINSTNNLKRTIEENKASQVMTKFNELKSAMLNLPMYRGFSTDQLTAEAKMIFERRYGIAIENAISDNCSSAMTAGFKTGATFGLYSKPSSEELVSKLTDTKVDNADLFKELVGTTVGSAGMAAGVTALLTRSLSKTKFGAILGAISGSLMCGYKWATSP